MTGAKRGVRQGGGIEKKRNRYLSTDSLSKWLKQPGWIRLDQDPETSSESPVWAAGAQVAVCLLLPSQVHEEGARLESEQLGCWHCKQQLSLMCHNATACIHSFIYSFFIFISLCFCIFPFLPSQTSRALSIFKRIDFRLLPRSFCYFFLLFY